MSKFTAYQKIALMPLPLNNLLPPLVMRQVLSLLCAYGPGIHSSHFFLGIPQMLGYVLWCASKLNSSLLLCFAFYVYH